MKSILIMIAMMMPLFALKNHRIEPDFVKNGDYMGIKILDSKVLELESIDGLKFCEISDIAYDKEQQRLYALSDKAKLFTLSLKLSKDKITSIKALWGKKLTNLNNKKLLRPYKDSEGLALVEDELLISFENRVRVVAYDKNMQALREITLPKELQQKNRYRGKNKGLEALAYSKEYGIITTAEFPLRSAKRGYHDIYSAKGKLCAIKTEDDDAITEMEMMPDGNLLVLQRAFEFRTFSFESTLLKVHLDSIKDGVCQSDILSWMSTKEGWDIDNYEGLTYVGEDRYLMISDNNNNPFEKTILTLFKIKEKR